MTDVFEAAGALREAYRRVDWAATPLGAVQEWGPTLRAAVDLALNTRFGVTLLWGPEFIMIYNEAYAPMIGEKHPSALGAPARVVFPEIWDTVGPMLESVQQGGGATWSADLPLILDRRGFPEQCYFTFSYSAVTGRDGTVDGVIDIAADTTAEVINRRRLVVLSRLRGALAELDKSAEVLDTALDILRADNDDLPDVDIIKDPTAVMFGHDGDARADPLPPELISADFVVERTGGRRRAWTRLAAEHMAHDAPVLVTALSEHLAVDDEYLQFIRLSATPIGQALERIQARETERLIAATERQMSETLQRSLLSPPAMPDDLQVGVRYHPVTAQAQVGGDWYDSFLLPGGRLTLVIGDVTGHDRYAAAGMAQIRNLLRGIAYTVRERPAAVLSYLDSAVDGLAVNCFATAILAHVEQPVAGTGLRTLRWSNAGHPPPVLLTPDGTATLLSTPPDILLGATVGVTRQDHAAVLEPGASLILYTDGCVERPGIPLDEGIGNFMAALTGYQSHSAEELCDHLLAIFGDNRQDDIAIIVVHVPDGDGRGSPAPGDGLT